MLATEEGKQAPFQWAMRRAEGMKNEQVHELPCRLLIAAWHCHQHCMRVFRVLDTMCKA